MALKKQSIKKIASLLKLDEKKLEEDIKSETEVELDILDDIQLMSKTDLEARDRNVREEGKRTGEEVLIKEMKKKHGVDFEGKDPDKFVETLRKKVETEVNANPDERIKERDKQIDLLSKRATKAEQAADQLGKEKIQIQQDGRLINMLPKERSTTLRDPEYLELMKRELEFTTYEGKEVVKRNGEILRDPKTQEPLSSDKAIVNYFAEREGWTGKAATEQQRSGRGGGNSSQGGVTGKYANWKELMADMDIKGININGEKGKAFIDAALKEAPELAKTSA
jgi:hypothetical protein